MSDSVITTPGLLDGIRRQLDALKGRWPEVCDRADVSYSWLCKFAQGRIPDPGVQRLVRLKNAADAMLSPGPDKYQHKAP